MSQIALQKIASHVRKGQEARDTFFSESAEQVVEIARIMAVALARSGKLLFCGNGGSAADSQHLAAEFVNRFKLERPPLPALALTTDSSILTAIGNDYSFDDVFLKQVMALGQPGDVLAGISTSGTSTNVLRALREGKRRGLTTIGMCGQHGSEMQSCCDHVIQVPSKDTAVIQEVHIAIGHTLCHLVDHFLFEEVMELEPYLSEAAKD